MPAGEYVTRWVASPPAPLHSPPLGVLPRLVFPPPTLAIRRVTSLQGYRLPLRCIKIVSCVPLQHYIPHLI